MGIEPRSTVTKTNTLPAMLYMALASPPLFLKMFGTWLGPRFCAWSFNIFCPYYLAVSHIHILLISGVAHNLLYSKKCKKNQCQTEIIMSHRMIPYVSSFHLPFWSQRQDGTSVGQISEWLWVIVPLVKPWGCEWEMNLLWWLLQHMLI